ncbi:shikimate kinase [Bacillus suaedaesalsae]|uniref:Shikimate kinase n=1 Tax=Bacillus suaedaesalsae TaxID=2810349 RepID=A0ABS2DIC2_9BACI|nr:shikimate kinase [Bacillus suaedaesalsae]MBM6617306.1 shikimate kinase [Bacillus suaedaesalsae]
MKAIFLTGFMGAGKTTIGKELSKHFNIPAIDSDEEIEKQMNTTVRSIFETRGENYFRTLETNVLRSLPTEDVIVTTGGGIVKLEENRKWMKENGNVIYLHCDFPILWERLRNDDTRPLIVTKEHTEKLYETRREQYMDHHLMVDTSVKTVFEVVLEIAEKIKKTTN